MIKITKDGRTIKNPVHERALLQRLSRALTREAGEPMSVKKTREGRSRSSLGMYFVLNVRRNEIGPYQLDLDDLVKMAKKHGAIADYENVVTDEDDEEGGKR
jgi:hypothetical protein